MRRSWCTSWTSPDLIGLGLRQERLELAERQLVERDLEQGDTRLKPMRYADPSREGKEAR
jgi:hypothetical protein